MRDQHPAVFVLHPLEQLEHRVLHVRHQHRLLRRRVALPPAGEILVGDKGERSLFQYFSNDQTAEEMTDIMQQSVTSDAFLWK